MEWSVSQTDKLQAEIFIEAGIELREIHINFNFIEFEKVSKSAERAKLTGMENA